MGSVLADRLARPPAGALDGVRPGRARARRGALPQTRVFYDASLEYGRPRCRSPASSTSVRPGGRRDGRALPLALRGRARSPSAGTPGAAGDRGARGELLDAYRPPLSWTGTRTSSPPAPSSRKPRAPRRGLVHGALLRTFRRRSVSSRCGGGLGRDRGGPPAGPRARGAALAGAVDHSSDASSSSVRRRPSRRRRPRRRSRRRSPSTSCPGTWRPSSPRCRSCHSPSRRSRSRSCAGRTPETCRIQQVCWPTPLRARRAGGSSSRTTATRRSRSASASPAIPSSS